MYSPFFRHKIHTMARLKYLLVENKETIFRQKTSFCSITQLLSTDVYRHERNVIFFQFLSQYIEKLIKMPKSYNKERFFVDILYQCFFCFIPGYISRINEMFHIYVYIYMPSFKKAIHVFNYSCGLLSFFSRMMRVLISFLIYMFSAIIYRYWHRHRERRKDSTSFFKRNSFDAKGIYKKFHNLETRGKKKMSSITGTTSELSYLFKK